MLVIAQTYDKSPLPGFDRMTVEQFDIMAAQIAESQAAMAEMIENVRRPGA